MSGVPARRALSLVAVLMISSVAVHAADISYGDPRELRGVSTLYIWQTDPPTLKETIAHAVAAAAPGLTIADSDSGAEVVFVVKRRSSEKDGELSWVTSGMVLRNLSPTRSRILLEPVSTESDLAAAVKEVTDVFIYHLQAANGGKYGKPEHRLVIDPKAPRFRSTAGLRAGMSKKEVRAALGPPTRMEGKGGRTQTWWYETTDGSTRVLFAGDAVMNVSMFDKEE